jgi:cobalt-zinc-cadmium efflux system outer membrane protein
MIALLLGLALAAPLTLDDVFSAADATHPLLDAEHAKVELAEADRLTANGGFDPTISAQVLHSPGEHDTQKVAVKTPIGAVWGGDVAVGWKRGVGEFEAYEGAAKTGERGEWTLDADLPLLRDAWTDRRRAALTTARQGVDLAGAELDQRRQEVLRTAGARWIDWVAAGRKLVIAQRIEAVAAERDRAYAVLESIGEASAFNRLDNQRLLIERQERRILAERALERAAIELSVWVRDPDGRPVLFGQDALPASFEPASGLDLEDPLTVALAGRPELRRFEVQLSQIGVERRLQASQALPALDLVGGVDAPLDPEGKTSIDLGLAAEWSIAARAARGRKLAADARTTRLDAERRFVIDRISAEVQDAESARRAALARVQTTTRLVELARAVEDGERARFELGDSNLIFVNQRELATAEAEERLVDAVAASWLARVDALYATGALISSDP